MKVRRDSYPLIYPIPLCLLGAQVDGKLNYETIGNVGMVSFNPNLIMISSIEGHHTNQDVNEHGTFSINYPDAGILAETDYCGMVSGKTEDKGNLFKTFYGVLETAPMIDECPVNLECRVVDTLQYGSNEVWIGEVVETYLDEGIAPKEPKKWPTLDQVNTFV
jgi:flavin reductase (DIM6/NTAB) family NADH-FMN oxidoreductase RutF